MVRNTATYNNGHNMDDGVVIHPPIIHHDHDALQLFPVLSALCAGYNRTCFHGAAGQWLVRSLELGTTCTRRYPSAIKES